MTDHPTDTDIIAAHRFSGWRDPVDELMYVPAVEEPLTLIPTCICGWEGDDWPAHVAEALTAARTIKTDHEDARND